MDDLKHIHLVLFLTKGATLKDWQATGFLSREAELYLRLLPHLGSVSWVTYGGKSELGYQDMIPNIDILYNHWRLPNEVYIQQLPWLHQAAFQRATIIKSEQTGAAEGAMRVARHFGKRYIARSGFSLALFSQYEPQQFNETHAEIRALEKQSFALAQQVIVTTEEMRQVAEAPAEKIRVIPNYVNTERFQPSSDKPLMPFKPYIVFAGRLAPQKNVENLLTALAPLTHVQVDIIGNGDLRERLAARIQAEGLQHIRLLGNVPNHELPRYFQQATLYVQPSRYEGHPKTIFEAMACSTPVVVGDAPGIRQFIEHGETGWLCGLEAEEIREAIEKLLDDAELRTKLGVAGREYVVNHFSLDYVVRQELDVLQQVASMPEPTAHPFTRPVMQSFWTYGARVGRLLGKKLSG